MPNDPKQLHIVQMPVDQRKLFLFAKSREIPLSRLDTGSVSDSGYILHCLFTEIFSPNYSPKPFAIDKAKGVSLIVLAYSHFTKEELENQAQRFAKPDTYDILDWTQFAIKPMPSQWNPGCKLAFEVLVCPVERKSNVGQFNRQKGAEMDIYLGHVFNHGKNIDRGTVYEKWTKELMEKEGLDKKAAVKVHETKTRGFRRVKFVRRDKNRKANIKERPEAFLNGVLEILDSNSFTQLLARGIGRHRAFGFGMLLLKPVI